MDKEQYTQFKVALNNFHTAKKNSNQEQKIKYYKVLRNLFINDLEFFGEIEKFINFNGQIKEQPKGSSSSVQTTNSVKRKIDDCNQ